MFESIGKHGALILAILLIVILLVVYIFNKMKTYRKDGWEGVVESVREDAYKMMLFCERKLPDENGRTKFLIVLNNTYYLLPITVRKFITKDAYAVILQDWYDEAKDILDDGENNDSVVKRE